MLVKVNQLTKTQGKRVIKSSPNTYVTLVNEHHMQEME
jgi:hypothetical protein